MYISRLAGRAEDQRTDWEWYVRNDRCPGVVVLTTLLCSCGRLPRDVEWACFRRGGNGDRNKSAVFVERVPARVGAVAMGE
jgi:hypothetical protein